MHIRSCVYIYIYIYIHDRMYVCMDVDGRMYGSMDLNSRAMCVNTIDVWIDGYGCNLYAYACRAIWIGVLGINMDIWIRNLYML